MRYLACIAVAICVSLNAAPPTRVPSWGPNGTHWPDPTNVVGLTWNPALPASISTPFPGDIHPLILEVDCSWSAIKTALKSLTLAQVQAGVLIKVRPGVLPGDRISATGSVTPVLDTVGLQSWAQRVTVCPRDGYGTVTVSSRATLKKVQRVAFVGFIWDNLDLTASAGVGIIWSWVRHLDSYMSITSDVNYHMKDVEFVEVVFGSGVIASTTDRIFITSSRSGGFTSKLRFEGCFVWPKYTHLVDQGKHVDSIQFGLGVSGSLGYPRDIVIQDCFLPGTHSSTLQRMTFVHLEHNLFTGGSANASLGFLPPDSSKGEQARQALNGYTDSVVSIDDTFIGTEENSSGDDPTLVEPDVLAKEGYDISGRYEWRYVAGSRIQQQFFYSAGVEPTYGIWRANSVQEGDFIVDESIASLPLPPVPTYELMGQWWNWGSGGTPPPLPTPSPTPIPSPTPTPTIGGPTPTPTPIPTPTPTPIGPTPTPAPTPSPTPSPTPKPGAIMVTERGISLGSNGTITTRP